MGKLEVIDNEDVSSHKSDREDSDKKHRHHHHHSRKSHSKKDDSGYHAKAESDSPQPRKHHHKSSHHHHHRHSTSSLGKEDKEEDRMKKERRRTTHKSSDKNEGSNEPAETSASRARRDKEHSRRGSRDSSPLVGSRLVPSTADSIRGSRRNSRNIGVDEATFHMNEDAKRGDANGSMEDAPVAVVIHEPKESSTGDDRIVERVTVTETTVVVEDVVVVVDTSVPSSVPSSPASKDTLPNEGPRLRAITTPPATPPPAVTTNITTPASDHIPDAGNPGKLPSPLQHQREKRFSSIIEPPLPWESKKDKKRSRRSTKRAEHKKNTLGETIYKGHPSWLLMRDIQTGLFQSIKTVISNAVVNAINLFHTPPVQVFPIAPGSTSTFKFKDYCPGAFYKLREHFGINHQDYVASICHNWNEVSTPGKSGSLFFFSQDNQYVLKTIPKREAKLLRALLPSYYHHMVNNDNSLLTRFMGLHRVKPHKGRQVRFLVMGNLFSGALKIHQRFDLKGSTIGRELTAEQRQKKSPTFKDMEFRKLNRKIPLGPTLREQFLLQLSEDCKFLVSQNIMDYSLLIGIHFPSEEERAGDADSDYSSNDENDPSPMSRSAATLPQFVHEESRSTLRHFESIFETDEGGVRGRAEDGSTLDEYYYIGIIDILMLYTMRKKIEHVYKSAVSGGKGGEISAVKPAEYAARFLKFITDVTT